MSTEVFVCFLIEVAKLIMNNIFRSWRTRINGSLPVPTNIQIVSSAKNTDRDGRFSIFVKWSEEYLSYQIGLLNVGTGKWQYIKVHETGIRVELLPSRYKVKVRCVSGEKKIAYGEWSLSTEFELSDDGTIAFQTVSLIPRLEFDPTLPVPRDLAIAAGRLDLGRLPVILRWQGEGPYQVALCEVLEGKWQYTTTEERSYTISLEPGRYRFKVRHALHDNPPKAGPWSEIMTFEVSEEFRLFVEAMTSAKSYETDTSLSVPEGIVAETETGEQQEGHSLRVRISWHSVVGRHQIALYKEKDESLSYSDTNEGFQSRALGPGSYRVKVRYVTEEEPLKAGPWSHFSFFTISEDLTLTRKKTATERIRESWKMNTKRTEPPSVIFIGGAARTGTTLLQSILCSDPSTNPLISEAVPIRYLLDAYKKTINNYHAFPKMYFDDLQDITSIYSNSIEMILNELRKKYECNVLVLKEPALTKYFPDLFNVVENVRFFSMIRDPRSTIASMVRWGEKMKQRHKKHFFQDKDMRRLSKYYLDFYVPLFKNNDANFIENIKYLRYEDLVMYPDNILEVIRNFSGLELHDYDPNEKWTRTKLDFEDKSSPMHDAVTELYGEPISSSRVDTYRDVLNDNDIATIEQKCSLIFRYFEYKI